MILMRFLITIFQSKIIHNYVIISPFFLFALIAFGCHGELITYNSLLKRKMIITKQYKFLKGFESFGYFEYLPAVKEVAYQILRFLHTIKDILHLFIIDKGSLIWR